MYVWKWLDIFANIIGVELTAFTLQQRPNMQLEAKTNVSSNKIDLKQMLRLIIDTGKHAALACRQLCKGAIAQQVA